MDTSHWNDKSFKDLSEFEMKYAHLGRGILRYSLKDGTLESILPIILQEVNQASGNKNTKNFIPVVGTFSILEQIGLSYKRNDMDDFPHANASSIKKALYYFAGFELPNDEDSYRNDINALSALRNGFLHSAGLLSTARFPNQKNYYFQYTRAIDRIIKYPEQEWDGNIETLHSSMSTLVNPDLIIHLANKVVNTALDCLENGNLDLCLEGGVKELYFRYLKFVRED